MKITFALCLLFSNVAAALPCSNLNSLSTVSITRNGLPLRLELEEEIKEGKLVRSRRILASDLQTGTVISARVSNSEFANIYEGKNLKMDSESWADFQLNRWRKGLFNGKDALHLTSLENLVQIRRTQDERLLRTIFLKEFLDQNKIVDDGSGLYTSQLTSIQIALNENGSLKFMDLGDLPVGIFKLSIWDIDEKGRSRMRSFLFMNDHQDGQLTQGSP